MKKLLVFLILVTCLFLQGCLIYGSGSEVCYIAAVEDGFFWGKVFTKTDLASSDADCYLIEKENQPLRKALLIAAEQKTRIKISYKKHFCTLSDGDNGDEIINFEVVN